MCGWKGRCCGVRTGARAGAEGDTWDGWDGVGAGIGLGPSGGFGGIARLRSTKKLEMIVMIIINIAIYTSTHRFCTHIYRRKDSWEWIESTLGYPEPPDLQPQLLPGIDRPNHTQALR